MTENPNEIFKEKHSDQQIEQPREPFWTCACLISKKCLGICEWCSARPDEIVLHA